MASTKQAPVMYADDDVDLEAATGGVKRRGGVRRGGGRGAGAGGGTSTTGALFRHGDIKSPAVAHAVGFLDSMGVYISVTLRRNPAARLGFALYILLLHLWVLFVLYSFHHHVTNGHEGHNLEPPGNQHLP